MFRVWKNRRVTYSFSFTSIENHPTMFDTRRGRRERIGWKLLEIEKEGYSRAIVIEKKSKMKLLEIRGCAEDARQSVGSVWKQLIKVGLSVVLRCAACLAASVRCLRSCFEHFSSGLCAIRGVIPFQYFVFPLWIRFSVSDCVNVILWLYSEWFNTYFLRYLILR